MPSKKRAKRRAVRVRIYIEFTFEINLFVMCCRCCVMRFSDCGTLDVPGKQKSKKTMKRKSVCACVLAYYGTKCEMCMCETTLYVLFGLFYAASSNRINWKVIKVENTFSICCCWFFLLRFFQFFLLLSLFYILFPLHIKTYNAQLKQLTQKI